MTEPTAPVTAIRCSICAKPQAEVMGLVEGNGLYVCNECLYRSVGLMALMRNQVATPPDTARCAQHPELAAVMICGRCGAFACAECALPKLQGVTECRKCTWLARPPEQYPRPKADVVTFSLCLVFFLLGILATIGVALQIPA